MGFQWRVAKPAVGWDKRFQQLVEYKQKHNDCNVPQSYPPDMPFGRWVMKQRCQQSLKLRAEKSQLTDEREAKLTALGFSWVAPGFSKKTVTLPMMAGQVGTEEGAHEDDDDEDDDDDEADGKHNENNNTSANVLNIPASSHSITQVGSNQQDQGMLETVSLAYAQYQDVTQNAVVAYNSVIDTI